VQPAFLTPKRPDVYEPGAAVRAGIWKLQFLQRERARARHPDAHRSAALTRKRPSGVGSRGPLPRR